MTHEERMTMLRKIEHVKNDEDVDLDFKAKILFLMEDLISKVEALCEAKENRERERNGNST